MTAGHYPVDTVSDDNVWVVLRRVHFYISDLIAVQLEAAHINTTERRILDVLDYARGSGFSCISMGTLCAVSPAAPKPATVASSLARLEGRGLVEEGMVDEGEGVREKHWGLTKTGARIQESYCRDAECVVRKVYDGGEVDLRQRLLGHHVASAIRFMNDRGRWILQGSEGPAADPSVSTDWSALRQVHFHVSDLISREIAPVGIGQAERRVLDALGFANKHGATEGVNLTTICRLNPALARAKALSALERMQAREWVEQFTPTSTRIEGRARAFWALTDKGRHIREHYKRYAQLKLAEVYETNADQHMQELLRLALTAESGRNLHRVPIVEAFLASLECPRVGG